jgi:hypothetical protein
MGSALVTDLLDALDQPAGGIHAGFRPARAERLMCAGTFDPSRDTGRPAVRFELTGMTFIDAASRAFLAAMHREGAGFVAADCLTKAVVAEITQAPPPDCGPPKREDESQVCLD